MRASQANQNAVRFYRYSLLPVVKSYRTGKPVLVHGATLTHLLEAARVLGKAEVRSVLAAVK